MDFKNTAKKFLWSEEHEENVEYAGPRLLQQSHLNIMVRTPKSFAEARDYADALMAGSAILISFDAVDGAVRNRIFDYLNGVSYIVGASVSPVSDEMLLYAPQSVEINKEEPAKRNAVRSWLG